MPQFPSREWMDQFCTELMAQPDANEAAGVLDGVYRFVIEPSGPLADHHAYDVEIRPDADAAVPRVRLLAGDDAQPRLVLTATYERWRQLITGQLDVGMAVMLRRLKVAGDLSPLIGGLSSTKPLMEALGAVDSQWLPE